MGGDIPSIEAEMKDRADRLLVTLGVFDSRARARAAIEAGLGAGQWPGDRKTFPSHLK